MHRLLLVLVAAALPAGAQTIEESGARIAARIVAGRLTFDNRSSLPSSVVDQLRVVVLHRVKVTDEAVKVTVSENAAGPMIIAETSGGNVFIERFTAMPLADRKYPGRVQLRPVRTQAEPILDFVMLQNTLAVLEPSRVVLYEKERQQAVALTLAVPMPRDPRGRLTVQDSMLEAHLPGTLCAIAVPWSAATCNASDAAWREGGLEVAWAPRRNYLVPMPEPAASIASSCTAVPARIVTSTAVDSDWIQALAGSEPLTERLPLAGPVMALWAAEIPAEVSLVVRNAKTGEYEASRLSLACDR